MKTLALKRFQILNLIIFALILAYFNFTVDFNYGDDIWASSQTLSVDGAIGLYRSWSGRVIAYVFQIFLIHNTVLFRILNTMIMLGMPITVWMLVDRNKKLGNLTLIVLLFMLYDYREMRTAGLVTTYITYYWTLFFNILFYLAAVHYLKSGRTVSFSLAIALVTGIIACNSELGALVNTLIFFVLMIARYRSNGSVDRRIIFLTLIPLFSILFFLTCPGLPLRSAAETVRWLPEFSSYTMPHKLYLGFAETLLYYFSGKTIVLMVFCGGLLVSVVKKGLPISYLFLCMFCLAGFIIVARVHKDLIVNFANVSNVNAYLFLMFLLCFCCFVVLILYKLFENNLKTFLLVVFILLIGLATRGVMGFSPTLYASQSRTFMYCDFAVLAAAYYVLKYSETDLDELCPIFLAFMAYPYFVNSLFSMP